MKYANIITGAIVGTLPNVRVSNGVGTIGAGLAEWAIEGWREVTATAEPAAGYRVDTYAVEEIDGLTCRLTVATSINIAEEQAIAKDLETSTKWTGKTLTDKLNSEKYKSLL